MSKSNVTVVIPSIPSRQAMLRRATESITRQTKQVDDVIVEFDKQRQGASITRNKGILQVKTEWTAFLDDDDAMLPNHIEFLTGKAQEDSLDLCWGWYNVIGGPDPFPENRGRQYDIANPHAFPITVLVKTQMLQTAVKIMGGFRPDLTGTPADRHHKGWGSWAIQDQPIWDCLISQFGANHMAFSDITWNWFHHGLNTSGLPRG